MKHTRECPREWTREWPRKGNILKNALKNGLENALEKEQRLVIHNYQNFYFFFIFFIWLVDYTKHCISVLWQEEGYTMKYRLSLRAKPKGFPEGLGYISSYFPTLVTKQTFSITTQALTFLGVQYWKGWFSELLRQLGNTGKYCPVDQAILAR